MAYLLIVTLLAIAIPVRPDRYQRVEAPASSPQQQILGDWRCMRCTSGAGADLGVPGNNVMILRLMPDQSVFITNGKEMESDGVTGPYTIDWSTNPATIRFRSRRGGTLSGLIKLQGDQLILALGSEQPPRTIEAANIVAYYTRAKN